MYCDESVGISLSMCEVADMSGHTYTRGLVASAAPRHAASLELGSILAARHGAVRCGAARCGAARRDSCVVECSQIVASAATRSCATYCEPGLIHICIYTYICINIYCPKQLILSSKDVPTFHNLSSFISPSIADITATPTNLVNVLHPIDTIAVAKVRLQLGVIVTGIGGLIRIGSCRRID